jgi:hypothetical protein
VRNVRVTPNFGKFKWTFSIKASWSNRLIHFYRFSKRLSYTTKENILDKSGNKYEFVNTL